MRGSGNLHRSTTASDYKIRLQAVPQVLIFHIFYNAIYVPVPWKRLTFLSCVSFQKASREHG